MTEAVRIGTTRLSRSFGFLAALCGTILVLLGLAAPSLLRRPPTPRLHAHLIGSGWVLDPQHNQPLFGLRVRVERIDGRTPVPEDFDIRVYDVSGRRVPFQITFRRFWPGLPTARQIDATLFVPPTALGAKPILLQGELRERVPMHSWVRAFRMATGTHRDTWIPSPIEGVSELALPKKPRSGLVDMNAFMSKRVPIPR